MSVDDSVSAVRALGADLTGVAPVAHLCELRALSFEEANVLSRRTKPAVKRNLSRMISFL